MVAHLLRTKLMMLIIIKTNLQDFIFNANILRHMHLLRMIPESFWSKAKL
ncbi:hypothetical protein S83_020185, partial [Arachis hypogaea]